MKRGLRIGAVLVLIFLGMLAGAYFLVSGKSADYITSDLSQLPDTKVAVLLGTSRYLSGGRQNLYFEYRMDAAAQLFTNGKVEYILVSGDNSDVSYNEPRAMRQSLVQRGIPTECIVLDYAGFRTLDSMVRAKEVFGQKRFLVVSQEFHNQRAVYIARQRGIEAYGYNAQDVSASAGLKTRFREVFARAKMLIDLYITHSQPKYLGEKVEIAELQATFHLKNAS